MPIFYKIDKERRLVMVTGSGVVTFEEIENHQNNLLQDPDFDPEYSELVDFSHIDGLELVAGQVRQLAQVNVYASKARRAILVGSDFSFGLARMYEALRESAGETGIFVFRDLDEALDWVLVKTAGA